MKQASQLKFWYIKGFSILAGMSKEEMMKVVAITKMTKHARGELIYLFGDASESIYFLKEGKVKLMEITEDGREVLLDIIGPGEIFGEIDAIREAPRTEFAQAYTNALLCEMKRKDFEEMLMMHPEMTLRVYKLMGLRLRKTESRLVDLICKDLATRVKETLFDLAEDYKSIDDREPAVIKLTQQDIASLIGASRQETSKVLKRLEDEELIELKYRSITVRAPEKLLRAKTAGSH